MDNHPDLDRTVSATHSASTAQAKPPSTDEAPAIPPEVTPDALSGATFAMSPSVLSRGVPSRGSGTSCYHPEVARSMIRGAWFLTSSLNCRFFTSYRGWPAPSTLLLDQSALPALLEPDANQTTPRNLINARKERGFMATMDPTHPHVKLVRLA